MEKDRIKAILRENLLSKLKETETNEEPSNGDHDKEFESNYAEVQRKLDGTMLKNSQVMAKANLGDPNDASDRSFFSKRLHRAENEDGGVYQFDKESLAKIVKVINNPSSYLNVKNK